MNIFILDNDPKQAARWLNDKHVIKLIVESAQLLSADLHLRNIKAPYKLTHKNHPCRIWTSESESMIVLGKNSKGHWGRKDHSLKLKIFNNEDLELSKPWILESYNHYK